MEPPDSAAAPTLDEIVALETAVWVALRDGDADADERLLSDDFLGVYPTGFADKSEHSSQLEGGPSIESFSLDAAVLRVITADDVLLAYDAGYQRPGGPQERMYVSSLWSRRDGAWRNVFSQDTPPGEAVP